MRRTYTRNYLHIVFSTKNRLRLIPDDCVQELHKYATGICANLDSKSVAIGGMPDHLHLLVNLAPAVSLSTFVQKLKANTSRWLNGKLGGNPEFAWQRGYSAFSVSESKLNEVVSYISNQAKHHASLTFEEEVARFLDAHGFDDVSRK